MIERGGTNEERLFIYDAKFNLSGREIVIKKTDMENIREIIHRHQSRYHLVAGFTRPGMKVLDFPCGSGYGYDIIGKNVIYEGMDYDDITIEYARRKYNNSEKVFMKRDLTNPCVQKNTYGVIACIEGLEHIEKQYQEPLIKSFYEGLKPGGWLIVTTPEADRSGPSKMNPYHKWELSDDDFEELLEAYFDEVRIINVWDKLHNGQETNMMFGICHRRGE